MANVNRPAGLKPVSYLNGSPYNGQARLYYATATADGLFVGDPVKLSGTGDANGIPGVVEATAAAPVLGVIVGVVVAQPGVSLVGTNIDLTTRSIGASASGYVMVADDPNIVFEIQEALTTPFAVTDIGGNCDFVVLPGATAYSDSATTTAVDAPTTTAALTLKILGLAQRPDNAVGQYAKILVKINNHQLANSVGV